MKFLNSSSRVLAVSSLLLSLASAAPTQPDAVTCNECTVRYIVVDMPPQTASSEEAVKIKATATSSVVETPVAAQETTTIYGPSSTAQHNSTATYAPVVPPNYDCSNPNNVVPKKKLNLSYGKAKSNANIKINNKPSKPSDSPTSSILTPTNSSTTNPQSAASKGGSIDMSFVMNAPAVALEYVDAVSSVDCSEGTITVKFDGQGVSAAFDKALDSWLENDKFLLVTSNGGNCNPDTGRGFYLVNQVSPDKESHTITCHAIKQEIPDIAESCEITFSSIPSQTLKKRITLDPSLSINFGAGLDRGTVLFSEAPYVTISADQAEFETTVTFSGYLKYNFWKFKLEDMFFDLDTQFSADLALSAEVTAAFQKSIQYSPDALTWSLVDVPGVLSLGPGVAFGIGLDVDASASVKMRAGAGIAIPTGNVHLDVLDSSKNSVTGWEPKYTSFANISENVDVGLNARASLTLQLSVKLLAGLVDLSSGLTATPGFNNKFSLRASQGIEGSNTGNILEAPARLGKTPIELPETPTELLETPVELVATPTPTALIGTPTPTALIGTPTTLIAVPTPVVADLVARAEECGISFKSDFVFNLDAFATKWWSGNLYHVEVPITNVCYNFENKASGSRQLLGPPLVSTI